VKQVAGRQHHRGFADRQPFAAAHQCAVDRKALVARGVHDVEPEHPWRPLVPLERLELFGLPLQPQQCPSGPDDLGQHPIEKRAGEAERRTPEIGVRAVGIHGAEQQRQDVAIDRIAHFLEVLQRHLRGLRLAPLARLAARARHQVDRDDAGGKRAAAVDHIDELRVGEARCPRDACVRGQVTREFVEEAFPGGGCAGCSGGVGRVGVRVRELGIVVRIRIASVQRRVGAERPAAEQQAAALGLEQGRPDVFANRAAIEEIGALARRLERVRAAIDRDAVLVRSTDRRPRGPRRSLEPRDGAVEVIEAPLGAAPAGHVARKYARQREIRGHPTSVLRTTVAHVLTRRASKLQSIH
jgi:hypothetical protein